MPSPAAQPGPPVLAPSGVSLRGRRVVYATVAARPPRYWPILAELAAMGADVVTSASIFGAGAQESTAARVEAYYQRLGAHLGRGDALVVLPADDGRLGASLWNTMCVAQQRGVEILIVAPTGHLRHLGQVALEVVGEGRPHGEAVRAWAKAHWRPAAHQQRLSWAAPARDRTSTPARLDEGRELAERARSAAVAAAAGSARGAAKSLANLARGKAAKGAAQEARAAVLERGGGEGEASAAATSAAAAVMRRPLEDFMDAEQRAAVTEAIKAPARTARAAKAAAPVSPDPILSEREWTAGELKALSQAKPSRRPTVRASLLRGRAAKAAAARARAAAEAAGAGPAQAEAAALTASASVMAGPLEAYMDDGQGHGEGPAS